MNVRPLAISASLAVLAFAPLGVRAADPTPAPTVNAAEAKFVGAAMRDLRKLYPTPQAAEKAGYVHYSAEDSTGAISYANKGDAWTAKDVSHPSQLWYDVKGRLLGADYSVLQSEAPTGPSLFGIDPKRFVRIGAHVHYVTCEGAKCVYGKGVGAKRWTEAGLDLQHPTAEGLVKIGAVKDAATVKTVFLYPSIYDVTVWVIPNPLGQFADSNPRVKPSTANAKGDETM